jgi:hypothetical protein
MTHHETGGRWGAALRTAQRLRRALAERLTARPSPQWTSAPYPLSGGVPGYPIARDAARRRR